MVGGFGGGDISSCLQGGFLRGLGTDGGSDGVGYRQVYIHDQRQQLEAGGSMFGQAR